MRAIVAGKLLQKPHKPCAQILCDGSLKLLELVYDDQQRGARWLLIENRVNPAERRELFRRIGPKCRAA